MSQERTRIVLECDRGEMMIVGEAFLPDWIHERMRTGVVELRRLVEDGISGTRVSFQVCPIPDDSMPAETRSPLSDAHYKAIGVAAAQMATSISHCDSIAQKMLVADLHELTKLLGMIEAK